MADIARLQARCNLNCSKVNTLGNADDLVLVTPTAQALQLLLNDLTSKRSTLSLQVNVQKSCNIVFRHSNNKYTVTGQINYIFNSLIIIIQKKSIISMVRSSQANCYYLMHFK